MPNKTCPKCQVSQHVRKSQCACGHIFYNKKIPEDIKPVKAEVVQQRGRPKKDREDEPEVEVNIKIKLSDYTESQWKEAHEKMGYTVRVAHPEEKLFNKKYSVTKTLNSGKKGIAQFNKANDMASGITIED